MTSDYKKIAKNLKFEDTNFLNGVLINYSYHSIESENLDLSFNKKTAFIYKNIIYKNLNTTLRADKIEIDLITKDLKVFMYDKSKNIEILSMKDPEIFLSILDDGIGMDEVTLKEAMRISSIDPDNERDSLDLGRFSLGLKTASYSQCTLLTVVSKTNNSNLNARQWDLDKIGRLNKWVLNSLEEEDIKKLFNDIGQKHQLDK